MGSREFKEESAESACNSNHGWDMASERKLAEVKEHFASNDG